jgi:quercetin dioxygenase-like cupin family protein
MRKYHRLGLTGLVLFAAACVAAARVRDDAPELTHGVHMTLPADDSAWHDYPPGLPSGGRFAVISGDPSAQAPFVMRVELPPGYTVSPYRRATDEGIVVLAGAIELGHGERFDQTALRTLASGSFVQLPANEPHFVTSRHGATVQIVGEGPFTIEYVGAQKPGTSVEGR